MSELSKLIAKDPLSLEKEDITTIIKELRAMRGRFNMGQKTAGSTKAPKLTAKESQAKKLLGDIDVDL